MRWSAILEFEKTRTVGRNCIYKEDQREKSHSVSAAALLANFVAYMMLGRALNFWL